MNQANSQQADLFYTTGRLTSEMVLKVAQMGISVLVSRSGVTQKGVELAERFGVMLIARAKGKSFQAINAEGRLTLDAIPPNRRALARPGRQAYDRDTRPYRHDSRGGEGRRMGGRDKGLEPFSGLPLVAHTVKRFDGHVHELMINANRNGDAYALFADRVIADAEGGFKGPLMGIYSGLRAARTPWLLVAPCDSPALPHDLVARMVAGIVTEDGMHDIAVAFDGERLHPVVALLRTLLADDRPPPGRGRTQDRPLVRSPRPVPRGHVRLP